MTTSELLNLLRLLSALESHCFALGESIPSRLEEEVNRTVELIETLIISRQE